jgi:type IV pilus assembly protein PilN
MIRINLLPFRAARKKENIRRQVSVFLLSIVLVLIVLGWIHFYLQSKQKKMTTTVADVEQELALYKKKDQEIKVLRKRLKTLNQRKEVIDGLEAKRFKPVHILDNLTQKVVPERMWLTKLSLRGNRLDLGGIAVDNNTVANLMDKLETIPKLTKKDAPPAPLYERVKLASVQKQAVRSIDMKKFEMVAMEKQAPKKKPQNTKKRK